jgi:uncharacterized cupin superfamily protein
MPAPPPAINRDEIEPRSFGAGELAFTRRRLAAAAGARRIGCSLYSVPAGARQMPVHVHGDEEELFVVLAGSGTLTLGGDEHPLRAGDVVARPPATGVCHAIQAGDAGLQYLVYGTRVAGDSVYYPGAGKIRLRGLGVTIDA